MGVKVGTMTLPKAGITEDVYEGWSWPCFFFGPIWCLAKSMWIPAIAWVAVSIVTWSAAWWLGILIVPWFANGYYRKFLAEKGYEFTPL